jgi:prophage antirepressor-like protein
VSALQVFDFGGRQVRTAGTHEAPLLCAADVCSVLGYADVSQACEKLDQDEVEQVGAENGSRRVLYVGQNANMYVTESGLYSLIIGSNKPEAKAFKRWVTSEVLPAIRRKGYYSAVEEAREKTTAQLLAACFPQAPAKAKPIFSDLILALLKMRNEPAVGNPGWAPMLAHLIYGWAIPIDGQQQKRRALNVAPSGSRVDHAMFSPELKAHVIEVARGGIVLAKNSTSWDEWRARMDTAYADAPLQLALLTPIRRLSPKKAS